MVSWIAYCGLDCERCPIHLATLEQDPRKQRQLRVHIARICRQEYGLELHPEDITDCDGCRSGSGRLFSGCARCKIRACARSRDLTSCAICADYGCEELLNHFKTDPSARTRLENMRRTR